MLHTLVHRNAGAERLWFTGASVVQSCAYSQSCEDHLLQLRQTLLQDVDLDEFISVQRHVTRAHECVFMQSVE